MRYMEQLAQDRGIPIVPVQPGLGVFAGTRKGQPVKLPEDPYAE